MKTALDMNFNEFVNWATGYILMGIGRGDNLNMLVRTVLDHSLRNRVFGGDHD